jgi:hypothetical protein
MGATSLPPDSNRDIRTDFSTDCATGTSPVVFPDDEEISLPIDLLSYPNQFLRARNRAEPATFAALSINFDLRHGSHPAALGLRPEVGGNMNCLKPQTSDPKHSFEFQIAFTSLKCWISFSE